MASESERAVMQTATALGESFEMLQATYVRHAFVPHFHATYAIGVVEAGAVTSRLRGGAATWGAGAVIALPPGEVHDGAPAAPDGWSSRMLYPGAALLAQVAGAVADREPVEAPAFREAVIHDPVLAARLRLVHAALAAEGATAHDALRTDTLLVETLGLLLAGHGSGVRRAPAPVATRAVERVRDYMAAHFGGPVLLRDLAAVAGLSTFHLVRVFRRATGLPPYSYLELLRVEHARRLLRDGFPIVEVALRTGFSDQSHLTRRFRRVVGVPPGQYARACRGRVVVGRVA